MSSRYHRGLAWALFCVVVGLGMSAGCEAPKSGPEKAEEKSPAADAAPEARATEPVVEKSSCPTPSRACLPGCGNDLGVGQHCTRGGGECNGNKKAILCTGDFDKSTDLIFCTRPCVEDSQCGENAVCKTDPDNPKKGSGCFPAACVGPPKEQSPQEKTPPADGGAGE